MALKDNNTDLLKDLVQVLVKHLIEQVTKEAISKMASKFPFLFSGPIGVVSNFLIAKGVKWLIENTSIAIELAHIDLKTKAQAYRVVEIAKELKKKDITDEEKNILNKSLEAAAFALIRFNS